ncbi:short-chain dehydrogenase/reductase SDR [Chloroherpeton thalassium ATCC 35110]|uniref:Short-chain dehydrogenase/reductase SDR n=1 Tax=Chloroherpeton thalassium (strain ATCC 35110 / GB-78) TaxID=517418 RepID=B3QY59_CHLT3|nr:SDR family oxidoreductase [Chloroherpeton thalassium]ACF15025.1 short-chain dehydrogenase/reductase SDR [Chloroherpeton thalassium ATCC 35110]
MEMFSLKNKTAVVTGALGLIGKNHCLALAEAGANVVVTDLNAEKCEAFATELRTSYQDAMGVGADIASRDSVVALRDQVLKRFGHIDILVNNAAINDMFENPTAAAELSKFENYPIDLWEKSLKVNVTGSFLCAQVLGAEMAKQGKGSIINVASTYGIVAPDQSIYKKPDGSQSFYKSAAYPVTKGAIISFTRFLAAYWGEAGVRVNTLSPGGVENGQDAYFINNYSKRTPLGRMAAPSDYRGAIVFLASDASAYMTGANLVVDGGWTAW